MTVVKSYISPETIILSISDWGIQLCHFCMLSFLSVFSALAPSLLVWCVSAESGRCEWQYGVGPWQGLSEDKQQRRRKTDRQRKAKHCGVLRQCGTTLWEMSMLLGQLLHRQKASITKGHSVLSSTFPLSYSNPSGWAERQNYTASCLHSACCMASSAKAWRNNISYDPVVCS